MKRKLAGFGLGFSLAELVAAYLPPLVLVPAAALFALLAYYHRGRDTRLPLLGVLSGLAFFALFTVAEVTPIQARAGETALCTVIVETDVESSYQEGSLRGTLRVIEWDGRKVDFLVQCSSFPASVPGDRFTAEFSLQQLDKTPYRMSYLSKGVYLQAFYKGSYVPQQPSKAARFVLYRLRQVLVRSLQRWMTREEGELEAAMLLGEKTGLPDSILENFRVAGVSHLLAVSGLHIALLCGIFSMGHHRRFVRPLILLRAGLILVYMALTGLPISVVRAGTMFLLALMGNFFLQPVDLLTSTGTAAILIGLQNAYAPCDVGFQLSFCAVLGVQLAVYLAGQERKALLSLKKPTAVRLLSSCLEPLEAVQVAAFAGLATMPVLIAQGMTLSGVGVLTNLLVVWMLEPALRLGIAVLAVGAIPWLEPVAHMISLVLCLWLKGMLCIVNWCAALPLARLDIPTRYSLLVLAVLAILAYVYWYAGKMLWYLPVAVLCVFLSVWLGIWAQKDVVRIAVVGADNNPCAVCTQNGAAVVLFRGGQSNLRAVETYLLEHTALAGAVLVDLRQNPSELNFGDMAVIQAEDLSGDIRRNLLDDVTLNLYHDTSGNLAVLEVGDRHIALSAGNIRLTQSREVDVLCAAGSLPECVQARTIIFCTDTPTWLEDVGKETLLYSSGDPVMIFRPGKSMCFEEVERVALQ